MPYSSDNTHECHYYCTIPHIIRIIFQPCLHYLLLFSLSSSSYRLIRDFLGCSLSTVSLVPLLHKMKCIAISTRYRRLLLTLGAHAQRGLQYLVCHSVCPSVRPSVRPSVCPSVCLSVCLLPRYAQQDGQKAIPTGSVPHWLYFKNSVFGKIAAFESYGVKTK